MGQSTKRTLFAITVVVFLLPACTPASAATQDPALIQQLIDQSVALTMVAEHAQATEQQALIPTPAPTLTSEATPPVPEVTAAAASESGPVDTLPDTTNSASSESGPVGTLPDTTNSASSESGPVGTLPDTTNSAAGSGAEPDAGCEPAVVSRKLTKGARLAIKTDLNLRTRPSRLNRIILTLKPGAEVEIVEGPVTTRYAGGGKYTWWKVQLDGGLQGWSAELSVCGKYYFMEPV